MPMLVIGTYFLTLAQSKNFVDDQVFVFHEN